MPEEALGPPEAGLLEKKKDGHVLVLDGLKIADDLGATHGPLDLTLDRGERVLIQVENTSLINALIRVILGMKRPSAGEVRFMSWQMDVRLDVLDRSHIYKDIGFACESFGLISGLSPFDNIQTFLLYHSDLPLPALERRAYDSLALMGLTDSQMVALSSHLNRAYRTLGAIALSLAKGAPLIILERPRHRLGRLFTRAWETLASKPGGSAAVLILALRSEPYDDLALDRRIDLSA
jgi:ABC-type transporter Mla maintaining outer membrane lipid asymmetry ATPase subunit MlaF